ncbi:MAG: DUF6285 domain-containing protein [Dehalococcoidia bacterium]|nr:DUF6285 domain-containing protein [Dehalococcoidia bacterium]
MQDRPDARELLQALEEFMQERSDAATDRYDRFQFRVAANTLAILQRELAQDDDYMREEWAGLDRLLGPEEMPERMLDRAHRVRERNGDLGARIRRGDFDGESEEDLLRHIYTTVWNKVTIANPREAV